VDLDASASLVPLDGLAPVELARAPRAAFRRDGLRFLAGRHALYGLLAQAPGRSRAQVALNFGEIEEPAPVHGGVQINVSHSGAEALIGLSGDGAIGVDIEQVRAVSDADALVGEHFTESERGYWAGGVAARRDRRFLGGWTRKGGMHQRDGWRGGNSACVSPAVPRARFK